MIRAMNSDVIQTRIAELLRERGRSLYWLAKETGIAYPTLWRLRDSKTESIAFRVLEGICLALECSPGDVLIISTDKKIGRK
jgi:putative transcriptional regulator